MTLTMSQIGHASLFPFSFNHSGSSWELDFLTLTTGLSKVGCITLEDMQDNPLEQELKMLKLIFIASFHFTDLWAI